MEVLVFLIVIIGAAFADYFWFDVNRSRWGWMKGWRRRTRLFVSIGLIMIMALIYIGLGAEYL
ncbi:hypothetical protein [Thalassobacillus hwangdonensis]|uniref:Uncharacterized protein n=1 Tax=Thalassobacillus hwangdonensis TaxID=546108 RepID=A0ABW3KXG9_9BACI